MKNGKLIIAEINTWVWLNELEQKYGKPLTIDIIPGSEWDKLAEMGFSAIWLMGIWMRSPIGKKISQENIDLYDDYSQSLPDWQMNDLPGSPYCIKEYSVDVRFGGNAALESARKEISHRKMKLLLDFVPNHISLDHRWIKSHPEYLVSTDEISLMRYPHDYFQTPSGIFAKARDPFFPPWQDCAQLNAYSAGYRRAAANELKKIGDMCDGVRCDMAMLMLNRVFSYTWQGKGGTPPEMDFWESILPAVKQTHPEMIFIAEAYWGLEWDLQQAGFDFCYDKRLYDRIIHENATTIRQHIQADIIFQKHLIRFIENHDEERAASRLSTQRLKAACVLMTTLPGASMFYEGQWDGRKFRNHVLMGRRQSEPENYDIQAFYKQLIIETGKIDTKKEWILCIVNGWEDNQTCRDLIAYMWEGSKKNTLIIVNYSDHSSQGRVMIPMRRHINTPIHLSDSLSGESFDRNPQEIFEEGLFVNLPAWGYHFLTIDSKKKETI